MNSLRSAAIVIANDLTLSDNAICVALSRIREQLHDHRLSSNLLPLHAYKTKRVLEIAANMRSSANAAERQ
jgi:hypothetical protein